MRVRTIVASTVVAAALCFPMAGVAAAQDRDCVDYPTQAAAQAAYNSRPGDPYNLDADDDGRACEWLPNGRYEDNTGATPTKGVETGAGGTADLITAADEATDDDSGSLVRLGVVGGVVLAVSGLVLVRRRSIRRN